MIFESHRMFGNTTEFHGFPPIAGARDSPKLPPCTWAVVYPEPRWRLLNWKATIWSIKSWLLGEYSPKQTMDPRVYSSPRPQCTPKAPMDPPRRPKPFLRCGFPHVPQLALPGPWVVGSDVGAQPPDAAQLRGDLFAQKPGRKAMGKHRGNTVNLEGWWELISKDVMLVYSIQYTW
jgi:hypothetical protein